ncbi:hypothetical protein L1887_22345 [Cichorium endivia]|nr:hypothetical protein L1887_22345 [Cichorium endivia]
MLNTHIIHRVLEKWRIITQNFHDSKTSIPHSSLLAPEKLIPRRPYTRNNMPKTTLTLTIMLQIIRSS